LPQGDPLTAVEARIAMMRSIRASATRFSQAFWDADDALSWLLMVRDEIAHTGRVRDEIVALLELPPIAMAIALEPATASLASGLAADSGEADDDGDADESGRRVDVRPRAGVRALLRRAAAEVTEPVGAG
jgi:hypothetical protein